VYDQATLEAEADAMLAFPNAFGLTVRFAMKACPNASILKIFAHKGLHFDASSGWEVRQQYVTERKRYRLRIAVQGARRARVCVMAAACSPARRRRCGWDDLLGSPRSWGCVAERRVTTVVRSRARAHSTDRYRIWLWNARARAETTRWRLRHSGPNGPRRRSPTRALYEDSEGYDEGEGEVKSQTKKTRKETDPEGLAHFATDETGAPSSRRFQISRSRWRLALSDDRWPAAGDPGPGVSVDGHRSNAGPLRPSG
jgi:hypothetical protein